MFGGCSVGRPFSFCSLTLSRRRCPSVGPFFQTHVHDTHGRARERAGRTDRAADMRIRIRPNGATQPLVVASVPATWSELVALAKAKLHFAGATGQERFYLALDGAELTDLTDIEAGDILAVAFNGEPFQRLPGDAKEEAVEDPPPQLFPPPKPLPQLPPSPLLPFSPRPPPSPPPAPPVPPPPRWPRSPTFPPPSPRPAPPQPSPRPAPPHPPAPPSSSTTPLPAPPSEALTGLQLPPLVPSSSLQDTDLPFAGSSLSTEARAAPSNGTATGSGQSQSQASIDGGGSWFGVPLLFICLVPMALVWRSLVRRQKRRRFTWQQGDLLGVDDAAQLVSPSANPFPLSVDLDPPCDALPSEASREPEWLSALSAFFDSSQRRTSYYERAAAW